MAVMKRIILLLAIFCLPVWAVPDNMSVVVMQANDGKVLFAKNATLPMTPASTTKLLTAYTALRSLGAGFTFKTQLLQQGNDIYIRFVGDPSLKPQDISNLLAQTQLKQIKGNIIIDASAFASPWLARGWSVEDTPWYFAAPVHAVILDENSFTLNLSPATQLGQPVQITATHPKMSVVSHVKAVSPETADTLCQLDVSLPRPHQVIFEGCWPINSPPTTLKVANVFPVESAQEMIKDSLQVQGIALAGKIKTGTTPNTAKILAEHHSAPLSELIKPILRDSNNIYTESLTKTLGGKNHHRPTFQAGSYYIQNTVEKDLQLRPGQISIVDGSGLSTLNLISAEALAKLLFAAYQNPDIKTNFIAALATSGNSGTLQNRLTKLLPPFMGKTGGMSHVSTIAGYHGLDTDNPLIYVVMLNHGTSKVSELKQSLDSTLENLIRSYFTNNSETDKL